MIKIIANNKELNEARAGVLFTDGIAEVEELTEAQTNFFTDGGYTIETVKKDKK